MKKPQFNSQAQRDEYNRQAQEYRLKLQGNKIKPNETYNEGLAQFLNSGQKKHVESESFVFLCMMLKKFLEEKEDFETNQAALKMAKDNFESYCEKMEIKE